MKEIEFLEEKIAHLTRTVEEMSDIVARQDKELAVVQRRLALLMEREAMREVGDNTDIPLADQRPPPW